MRSDHSGWIQHCNVESNSPICYMYVTSILPLIVFCILPLALVLDEVQTKQKISIVHHHPHTRSPVQFVMKCIQTAKRLHRIYFFNFHWKKNNNDTRRITRNGHTRDNGYSICHFHSLGAQSILHIFAIYIYICNMHAIQQFFQRINQLQNVWIILVKITKQTEWMEEPKLKGRIYMQRNEPAKEKEKELKYSYVRVHLCCV